MLWTGASWADIPERYSSHTLARFSRCRRAEVWDRLLEPASRLTTVICSPEPWFRNSVRNLKSVQSQSLIRPHKLRVRSESGQINSGERSILATLDVRFELLHSLPTLFDTRLGQPADDTSDQMAHHVLPFYDRPTPRVEATQVLVPIAINTK